MLVSLKQAWAEVAVIAESLSSWAFLALEGPLGAAESSLESVPCIMVLWYTRDMTCGQLENDNCYVRLITLRSSSSCCLRAGTGVCASDHQIDDQFSFWLYAAPEKPKSCGPKRKA